MCNSYVNSSTGYSPNEIMYASSLRTRADAIFPGIKPDSFRDIQSYCEHVEEARIVVHGRVYENVMNSQRRMEKSYNRETKDSVIESGYWVWLRNEARQHGLSPMYRGPWLVIERRGVNLRLADSEGAETQLVHLNRCKKATRTRSSKESGTPACLMQGNTDERLSEEVAQNETHIETAGSPSTNAPGYTEECDGLNSDIYGPT